jgi:hypothetical protein
VLSARIPFFSHRRHRSHGEYTEGPLFCASLCIQCFLRAISAFRVHQTFSHTCLRKQGIHRSHGEYTEGSPLKKSSVPSLCILCLPCELTFHTLAGNTRITRRIHGSVSVEKFFCAFSVDSVFSVRTNFSHTCLRKQGIHRSEGAYTERALI